MTTKFCKPSFLYAVTFLLPTLQWVNTQFVSTDVDDVAFYIHRNPKDPVKREAIIFNSTTRKLPYTALNPTFPLLIYVHGYHAPGISLKYNPVILAHLHNMNPYNLIMVDWTPLANPVDRPPHSFLFSYSRIILRNLSSVAERIAEFIAWLVHNRITTLNMVHLIGHADGAHICGCTGTIVHQTLNSSSKIGRITGLDPSGPLYQEWPSNAIRLTKEDAEFVDVIHTNAGVMGTTRFLGHVDILINGGQSQYPFCYLNTFMPEPFCSHNYAISLYAHSVNYRLLACRASSFGLSLSSESDRKVHNKSGQGGWVSIVSPTSTTPLPHWLRGDNSIERCLDQLVIGPEMDHSAKGIFQAIAIIGQPRLKPRRSNSKRMLLNPV